MIKSKPRTQNLADKPLAKFGALKPFIGEVVHLRVTTGRSMVRDGWVSGRLDDVSMQNAYLGGGGTITGTFPLSEIRGLKVETLATKVVTFEESDR